MTDVILRFDMRRPAFASASQAELYQAAIDICAWGDQRGVSSVHLSEHHGSPDGYCPSPLLLAAAIAARTSNMGIFISALIAPLHDPVRIAEELAVLDIISRGRVVPVLGGGYRREEFAAVGKELGIRKQYMDDIGAFLKTAWTGEPFEHRGRAITVTPTPYSQPRPMILMGGSSAPAARRAARDADYFIPSTPDVFEHYREELRKLGKPDPGPMPDSPSIVAFVAEDPDAYWERIAPHLMHETNTYARWADEAGIATPYRHFDHADDLRAGGGYRVYRPRELVESVRAARNKRPVMFHPLCGGIHPDLAWQSLNLFMDEVAPALRCDDAV